MYSGQTLIKLVSRKIPANAKSTIAIVPVITWLKYNAAIATATRTLNTRSIVPIFFFINSSFI